MVSKISDKWKVNFTEWQGLKIELFYFLGGHFHYNCYSCNRLDVLKVSDSQRALLENKKP